MFQYNKKVKAIHSRHVWGSGLRAGLTLVISHNLNAFTSTFKSNPLRVRVKITNKKMYN